MIEEGESQEEYKNHQLMPGRELIITDEEEVFETRDSLPFFKDPKIKFSLWTIIKDSIGKDISKMTVPVYFNSPLSLLQ